MSSPGNGADWIDEFGRAVSRPVLALLQSGERIFLPFLAGALLIATAVWWWKLRTKISWTRFLFPKEIWLHGSALFDLRWMVVKALLAAFVLAPALLSGTLLFLRTSHFLEAWSTSPLARIGEAWPTAALALAGLIAFVGEDFVRYWVHRALHRIPLLWQVHQLHHSAEVLTPLTVYRTHPIESIIMRTTSVVALGMSAGVAVWLLGTPPTVWKLFGVLAPSFAWNLLGSNLRHSHVWLSYPPLLSRVLLSPASHQIHHSKNPEHYDRNYGSALSIWDRAFGTYLPTAQRQRLEFGVSQDQLNHRETVVSALLGPFVSALRMLRS